MPIDTLRTLVNIHSQAVQGLRLMNADSLQQRRRGWSLIQNVVRNLGIVVHQMRQEQTATVRKITVPAAADDAATASASVELVNLACMFDEVGAHATADILDIVAAQMRGRIKRGAMIEQQLVEQANELDKRGEYDAADAMEMAAMIVSATGKRRKKEDLITPLKPGHLIPLSSRHCPDHRGVQVVRIAENIYQCPVDGKIYNYENGYIDYRGQRVPGGSIAGQTSSSAPSHSAIPHRIFDTRENILNTIN